MAAYKDITINYRVFLNADYWASLCASIRVYKVCAKSHHIRAGLSFTKRRDKMAIITISRGSYSKGKEVAEKVAERLGYECIAREVLLDASEHFNIPEIKLVRALHDAPSVLERFTYGKERYLTFLESVFLEHVQKDNVVYHGLAGHYFLKGINHVFKIRILADIEDRVRWEMERNISAEEALYILKKDDHERRQWGLGFLA